MGKIFYLMGKSASGKDTIYKRIREACPDLDTIVLYTTRPMREGETDGVEYHFTTEQELEKFRDDGKMIEIRTYQTVHGPWSYATVDDGSVELKHKNYVVIGTLESYQNLREYFGEHVVEPVYITVDDGTRLERALARERMQKNPRYEELCRRFLADQEDFSEENRKHCGIRKEYLNEDLETCVAEILERIRNYTEF